MPTIKILLGSKYQALLYQFFPNNIYMTKYKLRGTTGYFYQLIQNRLVCYFDRKTEMKKSVMKKVACDQLISLIE